MNGNGLKSGIYSTECWVTIISQAVGVAVLFGWVKPGDAHSLEDSLKQIIVSVSTIVINGLIVYNYVKGRVQLKQQHLAASSTVGDAVSIPQIGTRGK